MKDRSDLGDPPPVERLRRFPTRTLRRGTVLHRIHHRDLGPFWFASVATPDDERGGRFDLTAPDGSSYWALRGEATFLETIARRPVAIVPLELLDRFALSTVTLPEDLVAANTPVQRARAVGLTAEVHTTTAYGRTRRWAAALAAAGHRALIAIPRHDVTARLRTVTLFGRAGEHPPKGWARATTTGPVPTPLIDRMTDWGIRCLPVPFEVETLDGDR